MRIRISWSSGQVTALLKDTPTARKLLDALPCESDAHTWGDEVYFSVPVETELEPDARQVVDPGTVCFWVEGQSLAIPFGPTPISQGDECRLVTEVNILGQLEDDPQLLESVSEGDIMRVEVLQAEEDESDESQRPWGFYEVLLDEPDHKVKRITVYPGKRLSLQRHQKRSEHWHIIKGNAVVTLDDQEIPLGKGESVDIPRGGTHRVANPGQEEMVFIEIQQGDYFGEDDIERFEDDFGRA